MQDTEFKYEIATFAGGCFWCMISPFKKIQGVLDTRSGYTGGHVENPTYKDVKAQTTGHYEAVQIAFDPKVVSYERLLQIFWRQIDPMDAEGQFQDRGQSYRAAIFYENESQKIKAEDSKKVIEQSGKFENPIVTEILPAAVFYPAEEYHQDFYVKNPLEYIEDRKKSGRDEFIQKYWGEKH